MSRYRREKEQIREQAQHWQEVAGRISTSYYTLAIIGNYFEKQARRYGLIREFKENGII